LWYNYQSELGRIGEKGDINMIELKKITLLDEEMKECIALTVSEEREDYVESNAIYLSDDFEYNRRKLGVWESRAVYSDGKMVGLIAYNYYTNDPIYKETCYRIRPFAVDRSYVGLGYEKAAVAALLDEIRKKPFGEAAAVFATYHPGDKGGAELFDYFGFVKTDLDWAAEGDNECKDVIARLEI